MRVGYLVNQYPQPSHTFIRREIAALESVGFVVERFSLRPSQLVVDAADAAELARTRAMLATGKGRLAAALLATAALRPRRFLRALALAVRVGWRSQRGLMRHFAYLAEAALLRSWLAEARVRHLHAHFGTNSAAVAMLCAELGGPGYSFTAHGPEEFEHADLLGLRDKIRRAAFVVAVSEFGRDQLCRWTAPPGRARLAVVRCSIDERYFAAARPCPDAARLVCVGRLTHQKGQLLLLEALARLAADSIPFELVVVGDGPLRPDVQRAARRLGIYDRVHLRGWLDEATVRDEILSARALVLPSVAEGLPVVLMEAFALRRPVVATRVAGIPELVDDRCGWLVPPNSVEALAGAIRAALTAPAAQLDAMGAHGAERVKRAHDPRCEAIKLAKLFLEAGACASAPADLYASPGVPPAMPERELR